MGCIHFGCRDEAERQSWIEWMVRGTGQSSQPQQLGTAEVMKNKSKMTNMVVYRQSVNCYKICRMGSLIFVVGLPTVHSNC